MSTPKRFENKYLRVRLPVKNLYMTGVDIAGPGVSGALGSGVLTASVIKKSILPKLVGYGLDLVIKKPEETEGNKDKP